MQINDFKTGPSIRDPFVLAHNGKYYLYGTNSTQEFSYMCYISDDLKSWQGPVGVCEASNIPDGDGCYWAAECHKYNNAFYLFATYKSKATGHRGVAIFKSDSPSGDFKMHSNGFITPADQDAIDGTLYVDENGTPYMVYVHEWTSMANGIGEMICTRLSDDLTEAVGEQTYLFSASDASATDKCSVTDGPYIFTDKNGVLSMIWSTYCGKYNYSVLIAHSENNKPDGKWIQDGFVYNVTEKAEDGGHAMIFTDFDGIERMALHTPNEGNTKSAFIPVKYLPSLKR